MSTASEADFLVKVAGIDGYFATKSGGDVTAATSDVYNGGQKYPTKLAGKPVTANVMCDRPYDPLLHSSLVKQLRPQTGRLRTTISIQPIDADEQPIGDPEVFPDALLVKVSSPPVDAASSKEGRFGLEFAVQASA